MPRTLLLCLICAIHGPAFLLADGGGFAEDLAPLTILQINDVYSAVPVDGGAAGGLARVATLKKQWEAEGRDVEFIISGDFLSPSVASSIFHGRQMIDALGVAGIDLAILGNHEFDFGPDVMKQRMEEAKWTWLVSNVFDVATNRPLLDYPVTLVKTYGSLKVGYFGVCLNGEEISADRRVGIRIEDPFEVSERLVAELLAQDVDFIIALTHLDYADDRRLAIRCPEIDLILGGHDHDAITTRVGKTLISKADSDARTAARIDIMPVGEGVFEMQYQLLPVGPDIPDDPATAEIARDYEDRLDAALEKEVGRTAVPLNAVSEQVRSAESNLGNLLADAMREDTGTEIAILNAGSIRSNRIYPVGVLRLRDVVAIHPFGGTICTVELTGSLVIEALEHGVSRLGESVGRFPQVSGISFRVDPEAPVGERVKDAKVGQAPIDPERNYRVAVGDYMLKGGDGYEMLARGTTVIGPESGNTFVDVLSHHISTFDEVDIGVEGRIRFSSKPEEVITKRPVILDTDMGIDSVLGMLYLLKDPGVELKAVTVSHGVADVPHGVQNALRILEQTGNRSIPVAGGPNAPLEGERAFPEFWKTLANDLGGTELPEAVSKPSEKPAFELLVETLQASAEPVTIVTMGPLTNLALALRKDPTIAGKIAEVVAMGGAISGPGNVDKPFVGIRNSVAEWNIYLDPQAAEEVLSHGLKVRLIPVEATRSLPITVAFRDRLRSAPRDGTSQLLLSLLETVNEGIEGNWYYFWDTLAAVAVAHPEIMGVHETMIDVDTAEGPTLGQTFTTDTGTAVMVAEEINPETFESIFLETILD